MAALRKESQYEKATEGEDGRGWNGIPKTEWLSQTTLKMFIVKWETHLGQNLAKGLRNHTTSKASGFLLNGHPTEVTSNS